MRLVRLLLLVLCLVAAAAMLGAEWASPVQAAARHAGLAGALALYLLVLLAAVARLWRGWHALRRRATVIEEAAAARGCNARKARGSSTDRARRP